MYRGSANYCQKKHGMHLSRAFNSLLSSTRCCYLQNCMICIRGESYVVCGNLCTIIGLALCESFTVRTEHFCQPVIKKLNQGNGPDEQSAGVVYALRLVVLVVFNPWINYLSLVCWSTFWKHCFKRQLVRKFGMVQKLVYLLLCMNIYFVLFSTPIACSSCSSILYFQISLT